MLVKTPTVVTKNSCLRRHIQWERTQVLLKAPTFGTRAGACEDAVRHGAQWVRTQRRAKTPARHRCTVLHRRAFSARGV